MCVHHPAHTYPFHFLYTYKQTLVIGMEWCLSFHRVSPHPHHTVVYSPLLDYSSKKIFLIYYDYMKGRSVCRLQKLSSVL